MRKRLTPSWTPFWRVAAGETLSEREVAQFKTAVLVFLGAEYARRGWVQQYHIGALRNNNLRQFKLLGPDVGFDSINDRPMAEELSKLLSKQNEENLLPKTILYCLNPRDNEVLGTMIGNFGAKGCRARCSSAPAGGSTIRKTAWSGR